MDEPARKTRCIPFLLIIIVVVPVHNCREFKCQTMAHCISNDLVCDNINHCPDGTDEATTPTCQGTVNNSIYVVRARILNLTRVNG